MEIPSFIKHIDNDRNNDIPDYLHHYTSLSSFEKIISTSNILLFNSYQLNDYMENNVLLSVIESVIAGNRELFKEEYITELKITLNAKYRITLPYVFCLSNKYNSLSQWRNYGDDCNGVCITFLTKNIGLKYRLPHQNTNKEYLYSIHNIIYTNKEQHEIVFDVLKYALDKTKNIENEETKKQAFAEHAYMILSRFMSIFKLQEFSEEDEWRILYMPWLMGNKDGKVFTFDGRNDIGFISTRNRIKSYFPLFNSEESFKQSICEIQLGTKSEVSDFEIRAFLDFHNMETVKFSRSRIPYR